MKKVSFSHDNEQSEFQQHIIPSLSLIQKIQLFTISSVFLSKSNNSSRKCHASNPRVSRSEYTPNKKTVNQFSNSASWLPRISQSHCTHCQNSPAAATHEKIMIICQMFFTRVFAWLLIHARPPHVASPKLPTETTSKSHLPHYTSTGKSTNISDAAKWEIMAFFYVSSFITIRLSDAGHFRTVHWSTFYNINII